VGLLATIISTIDDYAFLSAVTLGRDIILRLRVPLGHGARAADGAGPLASKRRIRRHPAIRWSLLASSLLAIGMAMGAFGHLALAPPRQHRHAGPAGAARAQPHFCAHLPAGRR
jgi:hypothetical protein